MTKARYEFFLFLKASRLRYPARMSTNPMPTPPPKEAVLPFFIYPTTPPTIRTSPYGIVKQKSCIFFQLGFLGKILRSPGKFELNESLLFFFGQYFTDQNRKVLGFILFWLRLDFFVARGIVFFSTIQAEDDVVFRHPRVADTSTTVSTHNRARVVFVQLVK